MKNELSLYKGLVHSLLISHGFTVPTAPHYNSYPGAVLLRGDNNHARITGKDKYFTPNPGQMGSWGVFFADVLSALMDADILYIFRANEVLHAAGATQWTAYGENTSLKLLTRAASEKNLDVRTISGGVGAEEELFKKHPIYQPTLGVATIPTQLPVVAAEHIFINKRILEQLQHSIPDNLAEKIIAF